MSLRASVHLDFKTTGATEAKAAVRGVMQATQRAADETKKAAAAEKAKIKENERALRRFAQVVSETAKAKLKAERDAAKAGLAATRDADRRAEASAKALAKTRIDEARRAAREDERWAAAKLRTMGRIAREEERQAAAAGRQRAQGTRNARRGLIQTAAGATALGFMGVDVVRQAGSTLGVRSRDEMVQRSLEFEESIARQRVPDDQRGAMRQRFLATSRLTQIDPLELSQTAESAYGLFSDTAFFTDNQEIMARTARAMNTDIGSVMEAVGRFKSQMQLTNEQIPELLGAMVSASDAGSIEFDDIAGSFAPLIGEFHSATGATGMQGARDFFAMAQTLGTGGSGGAGSAVLMQNMLSKINNAEVQQRLRRANVNTHEDGRFVGFEQLINQILDSERLNRDGALTTNLQGAFGLDQQNMRGLNILIEQQRRARANGTASPLTTLANTSAATGNQLTSDIMARMRDSTAGRARQVGIEAQARFLENSDLLIETMTNMAAPLSELENRFPLVAAGLETFQGALTNLLGVFAALRLVGGGAVLASTVNAGAGALAGTTVAGAGAGAATGVGSAVGMLGVGAAGATGLGLGELFNWLGGVPSLRSVITGEEDQYMIDAREAERRRQASRGTVGTYRDIIQRRSSSIGLYGEVEAGSMAELLENARRQFNTPGQGGNLASVMQKMRDVGADDDMMRSPANRETWERAEQQVNRDRQQITEPIVRALGEVRTAIQTAPAPAPVTGSTTGPTVTR